MSHLTARPPERSSVKTGAAPSPPRALPPAFWRRWWVTVSAGELLGFAVAVTSAVAVDGADTAPRLAVLLAAGLVEGAVLGLAQARLLRVVLPGFSIRKWVGATAGAAALAWFLGLLPSTTRSTWDSWPPWVVASSGALLATALLTSIGTAQARVLPRSVPHPLRWVAWTALGWAAGLLSFSAVAPPLWHEGQSAPLVIAIGVLGGLAMATAMAAVTGAGLVRMLQAPDAGGR